ncbi:MAG: universal stress protein [Rickettsiaceae bacterium]|nr:MAG: universal stress protein [Rickettsiaceae bacterium]
MINNFKKIVVPIDVSDKNSISTILTFALKFASNFGSSIHLVYIIPDFGMKIIEDYLPVNWMRDQKEKYNNKMNQVIQDYVPSELTADFYVGRGAVYDEVIQYSNEIQADLIIISAVRPQFRDYMLGPNASKIVRHASIPVLVAR